MSVCVWFCCVLFLCGCVSLHSLLFFQVAPLALIPSSYSAAYIYAWVNRVNIGSDNGLSPNGRQAIIQTNAGLLYIGSLGTNFSEILFKIQDFSITKMHLKISSGGHFVQGGGGGGDELKSSIPSVNSGSSWRFIDHCVVRINSRRGPHYWCQVTVCTITKYNLPDHDISWSEFY